MHNSDTYIDPYSLIYQTPIKKEDDNKTKNATKNKSINVFRPYQNGNEEKEEKVEDKMPEFVDLSENAYKKQKIKHKNEENPNQQFEEEEEEEDDLPLLEELGICPDNIRKKLISVLTFHKIDKQILEDSDMSGPLLVFILFAITLILQTKTNFGSLYGLSIFGSMIIFFLMNLMSNQGIILYNTISVLGYCMLPVVILSFISIFLQMQSLIGTVLCVMSIILSSYSASKFFEIVLSMKEQKWLIFYPVALFYTCFVMLTIF